MRGAQRERGVLGDLGVAEAADPRLHELVATPRHVVEDVRPQQLTHSVRIACRDGVSDRGVDLAMVLTPGARHQMKLWFELRIGASQLGTEAVPQQSVPPIARMGGVQRHQQLAHPLELRECHGGTALIAAPRRRTARTTPQGRTCGLRSPAFRQGGRRETRHGDTTRRSDRLRSCSPARRARRAARAATARPSIARPATPRSDRPAPEPPRSSSSSPAPRSSAAASAVRHREIMHANLDERPLRTQPAERQGRLGPGRHRDERAFGQIRRAPRRLPSPKTAGQTSSALSMTSTKRPS